ncbi:DUF4097 family beta strand repeat-containing protein [Christensenella timonensis]|uniref:DUF4097 family beta strand repeat-containing protein n=1 Tax=Christensenella timonensis TaxID=1816678 RepID=UPI000835BB5D|nr:DUF4097 family beta strand repeat-containing protein [Christensenella timonensis]
MSKIGKIVIWTVVAVILAVILVWGIVGGTMWNNAWSGVSNIFSNVGINLNGFFDQLPEDAQTSTNFEKDAGGINRVSLQFVDERVEVVASDDKVIRAEQTSKGQLDDDDIMHYGVKNGELLVQSGRAKQTIFTNWGRNKDIRITLYIPREYAGILEVSTVSGLINVQGVSAERGTFDTTSGAITLNDGTFGKIKTDSTSGNIEAGRITADIFHANSVSGEISAEGTLLETDISSTSGSVDIVTAEAKEFSADTTSGTVRFACGNADNLEKISADTVSGAVEITLPENDGFKLSFDTVSGSTRNDFAMKNDEYKNGGIDININTVSGSLDIINR